MPRIIIPVNHHWKYTDSFDEKYLSPDYDDKDFKRITIPHTNIELPYNYFDEKRFQFVSCYRNTIELDDTYRGKNILLDFDGVMTDDLVSIDERGVETVRCSRADGHGIALLRERRIPMLILSKERNTVVMQRAEKLGIQCVHGVDDKLSLLRGWLAEQEVPAEQVVFVGNDTADVDCMMYVGGSVCPADAHPVARAAAQIVLRACGGRGAVRELCDLLVEADSDIHSSGNGHPQP